MVKKFLFVILSVFLAKAFGATFLPLPLEEQVETSSGVIEGTYTGSASKKIATGEVVTLLSFKLDKISGLNSNKVLNSNDFKVMVPGGDWDGKTYYTTGVPKFVKGEKAILLINKSKFGYALHNLSLGKYKIINENDKKYVVSEVFPENADFGKLTYAQFNAVLAQSIGNKLEKIKKDVYVVRKERKGTQARTIASADRRPSSKEEASDSGRDFNPFVIVLVLALLGAYGAFLVRER